MSCSASGLGISFIRNQDGPLLNLDSTKWKLERGNAYTVRLAAGSQSVDAKALAETKGVTIAFADRSFNENLRKAHVLEVRGEGDTIRVPLDGSTLALDRLEACFRKMVVRAERLIRSSRPVGGRRLRSQYQDKIVRFPILTAKRPILAVVAHPTDGREIKSSSH